MGILFSSIFGSLFGNKEVPEGKICYDLLQKTMRFVEVFCSMPTLLKRFAQKRRAEAMLLGRVVPVLWQPVSSANHRSHSFGAHFWIPNIQRHLILHLGIESCCHMRPCDRRNTRQASPLRSESSSLVWTGGIWEGSGRDP